MNPIMVDEVEDIAFLSEFVQNVREFDADILRMIKESFKIEVFNVKAVEFYAGAREDAVDLNLEVSTKLVLVPTSPE